MPDENKSFQGKKQWKNSVAEENERYLKEYSSHANVWRKNAIKMEDARYARQFSVAEHKEILKFRQAPLPISVVTAICDTADAMAVSAKPSVHVAPIIKPFDEKWTQHSRNVAQKFGHLIKKSWYDSLGGLQFDGVVKDHTNVGHGFFYASPKSEFGEFSVDISKLSWRYTFVDPGAIDPLYDDAEATVYAVPISNSSAWQYVKSIEPDLTKKQFDENFKANASAVLTEFDEDPVYGRIYKGSNYLMMIVRSGIEEQTVYHAIPKNRESAIQLNRQDDQKLSFRTYTEKTDYLEKLEADGLIELKKDRKMFLTENISIGALGFTNVYPIKNRNIIPLVYDHRESPYPYSRMWYLYPLQRAINKFIMSSILNMSLLNATRVIAEENSIVNLKEWTTQGAVPNSILRYRLPTPGYSKPPDVIEPTPIGEAWLTMPKYLTYMAEYISGIFGLSQGDPSNAPDTFSTVASLQSAGSLKIKRRMAMADHTLSKLGEVTGELYKEYSPLNGFSVDYSPEQGEEVMMYNLLKEEITEDEEGDVKANITVDPDTDLRTGFRKVRFTSEGSSGYEAANETALLSNLAMQLKEPGLLPFILERMNIANVDDVIKAIGREDNLESAVQQLEKANQDVTQQLKVRENQIFQLSKSLEAAKVKGQLDKELERFKSNPMSYLQKAETNQGERP